MRAAADSHQHCEPPLSPEALLRELRAWLSHKSENGMRETKGYADGTGHPHYWCAILFPDWDVRQKLAEIEDTLRVLQGAGHAPPKADTPSNSAPIWRDCINCKNPTKAGACSVCGATE